MMKIISKRFFIIILFVSLVGLLVFWIHHNVVNNRPVVPPLNVMKKSVSDVLAEIGVEAKQRMLPWFDKAEVSYPPQGLALLGFKAEKRLEVWAEKENAWILIRHYPILAASGVAGPKLRDNLDNFHPTQAQPSTMALKNAVQKALKLLGMEQALKINQQGTSYEALLSLLSKPNNYVSIVEVGFGISQILPIIAVSLLSPVNSLLIFEQPEIHLHPRAQAGLGELFLCLAQTGRRVLVETHSDHLINRLRRRVAEDANNHFEDWVNILFVHPPEDGQGAIVEKGRIDKYGQIENWPPDFLAESANDARAILLAAANKRIFERKQGNT